MRKQLNEIKATMWIEDAWQPKLQRIGDESIMERFAQIPTITKGQLKRANSVHLYLRVVTIVDLSDPQDTSIQGGMLTGDWQAGSDLKWPYQPQPPKKSWAMFRLLLRQ